MPQRFEVASRVSYNRRALVVHADPSAPPIGSYVVQPQFCARSRDRQGLEPMVGTNLGAYRVLAKLGEGGMGEVYRAIDTDLDRQVAIKVLPSQMATDVDRLARFEREARTLAALNHPHIAAIFGLERTGTTTALVMELVEGPTLAERIARGPIPLDDVVLIA